MNTFWWVLVNLCFLTLSITLKAQDFAFGVHERNDIELKMNVIDSVSSAVVLKEYGKAFFQTDDSRGEINLVFDHHVKVKIFNKSGADQANIVIPTYKNGDQLEMIYDIVAVTYNWTDGHREEIPLDKKKIYREEYSKYVTLTKFTMPNIQDGSIIEYSYRIISPRLYNFRTWNFQEDIPKLYSEFEAIIPASYNYNVVLRGPYSLSDQKSKVLKEGFRLPGWPIDCSRMTYIMKDIPAFIEEEHMTAASNFKSAMYFELSDVYLRNGSKHSYTKEWKNVDRELFMAKDLGGQMKRKDLFKDIVPNVLKDAKDELHKARTVYDYIKKEIKWNNYYGIFSDGDIKKALDRHSGNIADVNLALIAALTAAGIEAEAVILSTRENGIVNKLNPVISEFNYLIAKVNVQGQSYLLDASEPLLPFGMLPLRCVSDQGRVLPLKKESYWYDIKPKQKRYLQYTLLAEMLPDGRLKGSVVANNLDYAAYMKRKEIVGYPSLEEYLEKKDEQMPNTRMSNPMVSGMDMIDTSLTESYDVEMALFDSLQYKQIYFNPFLVNKQSKNPFNLNERTYPVDLGMSVEEIVYIDIKLPEGYELLSKPKDLNMGLPDKGGRYLSSVSLVDGHLLVNYVLQLNKSLFKPEEYFNLKEFFSRIIQSQKTDLVLVNNKI